MLHALLDRLFPPHHVNVQPIGVAFIPRCSCGWHGEPSTRRVAAMRAASTHVKAKR